MLYCFWNMACDGLFFSFWVIFCHFTPLTALKIEIKKKKKKKMAGDIIILHKCTKNHNHMLYCSWKWHMTDVIVIFHFGLFFSLLNQNIPKIEIKKKKPTPGDIIILHMCIKNYDQMIPYAPDIWCATDWWTDRRMDRWKSAI